MTRGGSLGNVEYRNALLLDLALVDRGQSIAELQQLWELSGLNFHSTPNGLASRYGTPGNQVVFFGDSITLGADLPNSYIKGATWANISSILSGQRINYIYNAGIGGDRTINMLARFDTDVSPYNPSTVVLLCGTNDAASTLLSTWVTQFNTIIAKIKGIGAEPVLCTIPPTGNTAYRPSVDAMNNVIHSIANVNKFTLIDFYSALVDPLTGSYQAAYNSGDNTHPSASAILVMANLVNTVLAPQLPDNKIKICSDDVAPTSSIFKGCFGGYSGTTVPTGWVNNAGSPSGSTTSYTTDSLVPGQLLTFTHVAASGSRQFSYSNMFGATTLTSPLIAGGTTVTTSIRADTTGVLFIGSGSTFEIARIASQSGTGPWIQTLVNTLRFNHAVGEPVIVNGIIGDEMLLTGVVTSDGGTSVDVQAITTNGAYSPRAMFNITAAITRGIFAVRFPLPSGSIAPLDIRLTVGAGTGIVSFGRIGLYNATRLGI